MKADYERQATELAEVLARLNAERKQLSNGVDQQHPALVAFAKYQNIEKLTREILIELVDHYACSKGISKENRCPFLGIFVCFMSILGLVTMLQAQELFFSGNTAGIAGKLSACAHDSVAGYDQ